MLLLATTLVGLLFTGGRPSPGTQSSLTVTPSKPLHPHVKEQLDYSIPDRGIRNPPGPQAAEIGKECGALTEESPERVTMRVLYVDDDPMLGNAVTRLLGRTHDVVYCSSVEAARLLLGQDMDFDLVISDVMMPGETGPDFHRWATKTYPDLTKRWIFMTGGMEDVDRRYVETSGADVVWKPNVKRLLELVPLA